MTLGRGGAGLQPTSAKNDNRSLGLGSRGLKPSGKANPCPICNRQKDGDCRMGEGIVLCRYGSTHHPPQGLKPGDTTPGHDGKEWAFTGDSADGQWAIYKVDKPRTEQKQPTEPPTKGWDNSWRYSNTFWVVRRDARGGKDKEIRPLLWNGETWQKKAPTGMRPLLNLAAIQSKPDATILVVEGEKTCDAAARLFPSCVVTTWSNGSSALSKTNFNPLAGRKVVLWPDNDDPGRKAMDQLAGMLQGIGATSVKVVANPPDAPDGWDLADAEWTEQQAADWVKGNTTQAPARREQRTAEPTRSDAERRSFRELLADALTAIRRRDEDTEMEARAEIMGRFKRSDAQITAALFRLLTEQETGRPAGGTTRLDSLDMEQIEGMDPLVDGFMPENDLGLMYGAKGSGKTAAALALSFAVIDGIGFLDHSKPTKPGAVLFIASDSGAAPLMTEMQRMGLADHPATANGSGRRFYLWAHSAAQGMTAWSASINGCVDLLQFVKDKGVRLVVMDSAKAICSRGDVNYIDNDSVTAMLTFMKETICAHASVLILSHDGTEKGSHSGAKTWAEVPSIVHNIQQIPDAPQERLWRVVKNRMGPLRELRYQLGDDGRLEPVAGVEVIGDARAAVLRVLAEAHERGVGSVSSKELVAEIGRRFRLAPKTVANTLTRMVGGSKPEVCRVSSKRGHYKLAPRLLADPLNSVRFFGKEEGQTPVIERDLTSSRHLPEGRTWEERDDIPASSHLPRVGKTPNPSDGNGSGDGSSRDIEMPIGGPWLVELPAPAPTGSSWDLEAG